MGRECTRPGHKRKTKESTDEDVVHKRARVESPSDEKLHLDGEGSVEEPFVWEEHEEKDMKQSQEPGGSGLDSRSNNFKADLRIIDTIATSAGNSSDRKRGRGRGTPELVICLEAELNSKVKGPQVEDTKAKSERHQAVHDQMSTLNSEMQQIQVEKEHALLQSIKDRSRMTLLSQEAEMIATFTRCGITWEKATENASEIMSRNKEP